MKNCDDLFVTDIEKQKRREITELMAQWKSVIGKADKIVFPDDNKAYDALSYFNADGFFPGYYNGGNTKILFIGRESRYVSGGDRIENDLALFRSYNPNQSSYWRRLLYMVYAIRTRGRLPYESIPYAHEILADMNARNDYGFAIMNVSKYSNDAEDGATADFGLINRFLVDSGLAERNFIREEIAILDPDIIITANLWECGICADALEKIFPANDFVHLRSRKNAATLYDFRFEGKTIKLLDVYHFSCRGSDRDMFYNPVAELLFSGDTDW